WPLLVGPDFPLDQGRDAPLWFAGLLVLVLAVALAEVADGGLDARAVATLGVLSALGAAVRALGAGTAGLETIFFLLILAGRVFGPGFGFVLGDRDRVDGAELEGRGGAGPGPASLSRRRRRAAPDPPRWAPTSGPRAGGAPGPRPR
ncbi:MAG: hypothetical protein ACOCYR_06095, partial [Erythrobacter sp.]